MATVGVRELRNRLSHYLDRVREGERITVTDRGREVAVIAPSEESEEHRRLMALVAKGELHWNGRKLPDFEPIKSPGKPASEMVLEDRV